jgi:hypothetical protein
MATVIDHIDRLRAQPEHVRQRIAFGVSGGITALVVVVWAMVLTTSGTLALKPADASPSGSGANPDAEVKQAFTETKSAFSSLMGAAGAAIGATSSEAALTIITANESTTMDTKIDNATDKTVIPF